MINCRLQVTPVCRYYAIIIIIIFVFGLGGVHCEYNVIFTSADLEIGNFIFPETTTR